jgi:hypothetical protein
MSTIPNRALLRRIKKSRMIPDALDFKKFKTVTPEIFWSELDSKVELNFEKPEIKQIALDEGLSFDVILPDSVLHTMDIEVFFDEEGSVEMVNFDPGNSVHDALCEMLGRSQVRGNVELGLT